ncbi:MAG: squalene--hopene cyclase [Phycisphaerales bacterium]|nr:squalene--hopene cyclase [Phycisphaerales bacterium]
MSQTISKPAIAPAPPHTIAQNRSSAVASDERLPERATSALREATSALLAKLRSDRAPQGAPHARHWCAELEGDSILSSEYLLMKFILGQEHDEDVFGEPSPTRGETLPTRPGRQTFERIANHLRLVQREDGSWGQYPGSKPDISGCVKAYLALKAMGDDVNAPHMRKARERIIELGGAEKCNTFSTFYLACMGCVDWDACPAIPPEIVFLPRWFPFHMDKVSAWTRTMILPLAICSALRPARQVRDPHGNPVNIDELFVNLKYKRQLAKPWQSDDPMGWKNFFLLCDRLLKVVQHLKLSPMRSSAIKAAEAWIIDRVRSETTEGLGAIFPPMVYLQVAFQALGYARSHPIIQKAERDLDDFMLDEPNADPRLDHVRLQPCFSPVWDTGIALYALTEAGLTAEKSGEIASVCDWLIARQVKMTGDWVRNLRPEDQHIRLGEEAAAWAFEYHNDWYPDIDDTAMIAKALMRAGDRRGETINRATAAKAFRWIVAMQNDDGGWAAFDKTTHREWMEAIPFADHNAMQDPSCADITGRTIESLVTCGMATDHPAIINAVRYLLNKQEPEGCWWGRWGNNYVYGTWQALGGLTYAGLAKDHPSIQRAIAWVKSVQNPDGGFGETADSYLDRSLMGKGPSTASQTAWGLACLLYACDVDDPAVTRAVRWLCDHQLYEDKPPFTPACCTGVETFDPGTDEHAATDFVSDKAGSWSEHFFTGTGFPKVFYLRYNMYRHYFPVMSLARYVNMCKRPSKAP